MLRLLTAAAFFPSGEPGGNLASGPAERLRHGHEARMSQSGRRGARPFTGRRTECSSTRPSWPRGTRSGGRRSPAPRRARAAACSRASTAKAKAERVDQRQNISQYWRTSERCLTCADRCFPTSTLAMIVPPASGTLRPALRHVAVPEWLCHPVRRDAVVAGLCARPPRHGRAGAWRRRCGPGRAARRRPRRAWSCASSSQDGSRCSRDGVASTLSSSEASGRILNSASNSALQTSWTM